MPTTYPDSVAGSANSKFGTRVDFYNDFGCACDGTTDDTTAAQHALDSIAGASMYIYIPHGRTLAVNRLAIPSGVVIAGDGPQSRMKFIGSPSAGIGRLDIASGVKDWALENFGIDGGVTAPVGLDGAPFYTGAKTPMDSSLTRGSSVWIHGGGGAANGVMQNLRITHTGGYSILFDATAGSMAGYRVRHCKFYDNRPHLFGDSRVGAANIYGAWTSGIHYESDGLLYSLDDLAVEDLCTFLRLSGHCFWGHAAALSLLNSNIRFNGNFAQDHALDMCEMGAVNGFQVRGNRSSRGGYLSSSDGAVGVPKWGTVTPSVIDHTGLCINGDISGNTLDAVNGTAIDGDGLASSSITGNTCTSSWSSSDPNAAAGSCGPLGGGSNISAGVNLGNSNGNAGGSFVAITGNSFSGFGAGAIRCYAGRNGKVTGNTINHPANATVSPIVVGPLGAGANLRAKDNDISGNTIFWSPGSTGAAVAEDGSNSAFVSGDVNLVKNNTGAGNFYEFFKDPNSSSTTGPVRADSVTASATDSGTAGKRVGTIVQTEGVSLAAHALKEYRSDGILLRTSTATTTNIPSLTISGSGAIDNIRNFSGNSLTISGAAHPVVIDSAANMFGNSVTINGAAHPLAIDNVANAYLNSVTINGSAHPIAIDAAANSYLNSLTINGAATPLVIDSAANGAFRSMLVTNNVTSSTGGFAVGSTGVITNARDFYSNSLSVGSTPTIAASAAGLAIANDRTAYLSQIYIGANGGTPTLVINSLGQYVGPISVNPQLTLGSSSYTGGASKLQPFQSIAHGAFDGVFDQSAVVGLVGPAVTTTQDLEYYFHPVSSSFKVREAGGTFGLITPSSVTSWEANGLIAMVVNNAAATSSFVGSCALSGFAVAATTGAAIWGANLLVRDYTFENPANRVAATVNGIEMDVNISHASTTFAGINVNVAWLTPTAFGQPFQQPGSTGFSGGQWVMPYSPYTATPGYASAGLNIAPTGSGITLNPGYYDYAINCNDYCSYTALRVGKSPTVKGNGSQFIDFTSSSPGAVGTFVTRMFIGGGTVSGQPGDFVISTDTFNNSKLFRFDRLGNFKVDGTTGLAGIATSAGYIQSAEGFYTTSALSNALNIPSGGAVIGLDLLVGPAACISGSTPGGNGTLFAFNAHNFGGGYVALATGNRSAYWELSNTGTKLVVTSGTQTAGSALTSAVTALAIDVFGNLAVGGNLSISGAFSPASIAATGNITSGGSISCLGSFSTVSGFVSASLVGANTFQANSGTVIDSGRNGYFNTLTINFGQVFDTARNLTNVGSGSFSGAVSCAGIISLGGGGNFGTNGISCGGINVSGSNGQNRTVTIPGGFTVSGAGGTFTHLIFLGGVLMNWN